MSPAQNADLPAARLVTESNVLRVGPLPGDGALVVVAGKVGGDGQAFDVLGVEPVGGGQLPVGLTPRLAFERLGPVIATTASVSPTSA